MASIRENVTTISNTTLSARNANNVPMPERFNLTIAAEAGISAEAAGAATPPKSHLPIFNASPKQIFRFRHSKINLQEALQGVDEQAWYSTYGCTAALLSLAHMFYLKHLWGVGKHVRRPHSSSRSRSTQTTLVSYHKVVRRKQFHLLVGAVLTTMSHPQRMQRSGPSLQLSRVEIPTGNQHLEEQSQAFPPLPLATSHNRWHVFLNAGPLGTGNILPGLPLLFYCAHCLWACRALEVIYNGSDYARVLWTLTWTSFALDFTLTYLALTIVREMNFGTSTPFIMGASLWTTNSESSNSNSNSRDSIASRVEQTLTHRSVGGLTATTAAVLFLFQDQFDAPIPILPFLSTKVPILGINIVSWLVVIAILLRLSQSTHPAMGVACGTIAGLFWVSGWTFWLAEPYWSNGTLLIYLGLFVLSLRVHDTCYLPCIDYAPWDAHGDVILGPDERANSPMGRNQENDDSSIYTQSSHDDREEEDGEDDVRDDNLTDIADVVPLLPATAASMTMRSRRGAPSNTRT